MDNREGWILDQQVNLSGNRKIFLSIGAIRCAIISHDSGFLDLLRARYKWFESCRPADYEILVRLLPSEEIALEKIGRPSQTLIKHINSGNNYIIKQVGKLFVAVANTVSKKVLVQTWRNEDCFDSFLSMLFTLILAYDKGLLLCASAVSENGWGSVFLGPPGSGKTTVIQLSSGRMVLSDEMVILKPHNGGFRVYGTPFGGEFIPYRSNFRAELGGLYLLKKDRKNWLKLLDKVQAQANLYQGVPAFTGDYRLKRRILDTCRVLADKCPVNELHFLPDPSFWQVLEGRPIREGELPYRDIQVRQAAERGGIR
jgi:hypothetical protein